MDYIDSCIGIVVSMFKVYSWMRSVNRLQRILDGKLSWWEERSLADLVSGCMSKQKRNRKTSLQSICECDFYYQEASYPGDPAHPVKN